MATTAAPRDLAVHSVGMVSAVGLDALASCAAIRARISRFQELRFHDDLGEPIVGAVVGDLLTEELGTGRLVAMLSRAIAECVKSSRISAVRSSPAALLVATDIPPGMSNADEFGLDIFNRLHEQLPFEPSSHSSVFTRGVIGFFRALERARELLSAGAIQNCVVAAVDSLVNGRTLRWLGDHGRLKTERNSDGVIPGEAAAALWLTKASKAGQPMLRILGLGFGDEQSVGTDGMPNRAVGLADAIRAALADARLALPDVDYRIGGMTGERLGFMEASTALARVQRVHKDDFELWVPAEKLGDVGAALPACMAVVAAVSAMKGYAPGRTALLYASSPNSGDRGACIVASPREQAIEQ